jgi:recombinational DNA repair ATPase RecF
VVVIKAPAGIGKTDLLAAVRRLATGRGFRPLKARGHELEADMAFAVVSQLLAGATSTGAGALGCRRVRRRSPSAPRCTGCTGCASTWLGTCRCC